MCGSDFQVENVSITTIMMYISVYVYVNADMHL